MTFTFELSVFQELVERYPTWEQLQAYLESEEGGLFRIIDKDENGLCLIRYEKGSSNMNLPHSAWFRSVVWNTHLNRPVCIAPCKTSKMDAEHFPYTTLDELKTAGIICQELMEGFMINCFRMKGDSTLYITTRSKLNAAGTFYSNKSFRELFIESYVTTFGYQDYSEQAIQTHSDFMVSPKEDEIAVCYSFLVQHREHKIVKSNVDNRVFLVLKGVIKENGHVAFEDTPNMLGQQVNIPMIPLEKKAPRQGGNTYAEVVARRFEQGEGIVRTEIEEWVKRILLEHSKEFQGVVMKDGKGNRWRFRSDTYSAIRSLRGNSPSIRDRFCQLYASNLIHKYLEFYPEDSWSMSVCLMHVNAIIKTLYSLYIELHIRKTKKPDCIDKMFLPHLYNIHGIYLSQLRPTGKNMSMTEVQVYLHKQPWQRLSFLIRNTVEQNSLIYQNVGEDVIE